MGVAHVTSVAHNTMGIITLGLVAGTASGTFDMNPDWLDFLKNTTGDVPVWVKVACALVIAAGTASGGYRIIRTMGHKMVKLRPVHGFAAELTSASILIATSRMGMPVSTTHVVSTSIMGVGFAKDPKRVSLSVVKKILWAWALTLPVSTFFGYNIYNLLVFLIPPLEGLPA